MVQEFICINDNLRKLPHVEDYGRVNLKLLLKSNIDKNKPLFYNMGLSIVSDDFCCGSYNLGDFAIYDNNFPDNSEIYKDILKNIFEVRLYNSNASNQRTNILCTMVVKNYLELLKSVGFNIISTFNNCKTGNDVYILQYIINHGHVFDEEPEDYDEDDD